MKTNLFIATALLLSATSFGQQADSKTSASQTTAAAVNIESDPMAKVNSAAGVTTRTSGSIENQAELTKKRTDEAGSAVEKNATGQIKTGVDKAKDASETNASLNTSADAKLGVNASSGDNKLSQNASLKTGINASSDGIKNQAKSKADKAVQSTKKSATGIKNSVKPLNASIKSQSQIHAIASVKIK